MGEKRVVKFMPHYDGPYTVIDVDENHSTMTLHLPNSPNISPTFHTSDMMLFPSRRLNEPNPIMTDDGTEEYYIE
jgi:hypothetical protein